MPASEAVRVIEAVVADLQSPAFAARLAAGMGVGFAEVGERPGPHRVGHRRGWRG